LFRASANNKDYWDERFKSLGSLRLFKGNDWEEIFDGSNRFPHTMNQCSDGVFMLRWRVASPSVQISVAIANNTEVISNFKTGSYGYAYGTNCEEPFFKFTKSSDRSTLSDIYYEIKFWKAVP
jgi:hypothetical protein